MQPQTATFGAGCFWGVEAAFRAVDGVTDTAVGFMGGTVPNPSYERVCQGDSGHAEVCQVQFDPTRVTYEQLLTAFWKMHDPTQVDRQGPDVGRQYRSVIFAHSPEQERTARASKVALEQSGTHQRLVATTIEPAQTFSRAEDEHQHYHEKHGGVC
ncbi:MAG: peptide-methionine (S)-S-oxide reductase MsrA [bacterium]|nr:peptide-methionine (S)-S-oxide reductase MsrA [bacterium]